MLRRKLFVILFAAVALMLHASPADSRERVHGSVSIQFGSPAPEPDYVWVPGYWYGGPYYGYWVEGHWGRPYYPNYWHDRWGRHEWREHESHEHGHWCHHDEGRGHGWGERHGGQGRHGR